MKIKAKRLKTIISMVVITVCIVLFAILQIILMTNSNNAHQQCNDDKIHVYNNVNEVNYCGDKENFSYAYMSSETDYFLIGNNIITIPFTVNSASTITNYTYSCYGLQIQNSYQINKEIVFDITFLENMEDCKLEVDIYLSDNKNITANLHAIKNEYGIFISRYSADDALNKYLNYAIDNEILTEDEALNLEMKRYEDDIEYCTLGGHAYGYDTSIQPLGTADTYAHGTLAWIDDANNMHPLRRVKVEVRDSDAIGSDLLATTYTDNTGYYSASFDNSTFMEENSDLFLRIFPGDGNVTIYKSNGTNAYFIDTDHEKFQNVSNGSDTEISFTLSMSDGDAQQAMQIGQAILTARDFAWNMMDSEPSAVTVRYPYGSGAFYRSSEDRIYVPKSSNTGFPNSYASWDVLMHEYGHHIEYLLNINAGIGGTHFIGANMVDHFMGTNHADCKNECYVKSHSNLLVKDYKKYGVELAWAEGWASVFGLIAQKYYLKYLNNIETVGDSSYTAYNSVDIDYNNNHYKNGESCEDSVSSILWDLFDTDNDGDYDNISLSYQNWWDITTGSGVKTFSAFIQNFYAQYPEYIGNIGKNLERFNFTVSPYVTSGNINELNYNMTNFNIKFNSPSSGIYYNLDEFYLVVFSEDYSQSYIAPQLTNREYTVSPITFDMVKNFVGDTVHIVIRAKQSGICSQDSSIDKAIVTGPYYSHSIDVPKKIFISSVQNNESIITGTYSNLVGSITIPAELDGYPVTAIANFAFRGNTLLEEVFFEDYSLVTSIGIAAFQECSNLRNIIIPHNVTVIEDFVFSLCGDLTWLYSGNKLTKIGKFAFYETKLSSLSTIDSTITSIGHSAFYNSQLPSNFQLPSNSQLTTIGNYAFGMNSSLKSLVIPQTIVNIGNYAFKDCSALTIYTDYSSKPSGWENNWNDSNRPVIWNCSISSGYVTSFTKSASNPSNANANNGISNPYRKGYTFNGWYTDSDFSGTQYIDISSAPNGTLYAKWSKNSCVTEGTLITLADGSQVAVENLTGNESLLVWNMLTGQFDVAPILFIDHDLLSSYEVITLTFSDGTTVRVIDEHAFFDMTIGKYVFLRKDAAQYIGHYFNKQNGDTWTTVQLVNVTVTVETTTAWSPVTYSHLCYYVNGMLSMPGATEGFINIFDVDTTLMKYDAAEMANDIETYGLYTYEEFNEIIPLPETVFNAFNGQYLKVSIGKGLITLPEIAALVERYAVFFN